MKAGFYPKLAWSGIRKNSRLYTPYLFTCTGMIMMFYIIQALALSDLVRALRGGSSIVIVLQLGCFVMVVFSLIFLFYTNSFLIRRRQKEFGLYNILGMGKRSIGRILFWEFLFTSVISLAAGLALGIALLKLAELGLVNIAQGSATFALSVSPRAVSYTVVFFMLIFFLIFLRSLWRIHANNPAQLLRSESAGEKPPKANWVMAVLGALMLAGAYYLSVSIQDPMSALVWFFVAVVMVIIGTYMLFISGSVALCRLLQKNKNYYYKPNHFVSVSSMVFRMKRNGAGLASICILATMVLVMISSTTCLYFGAEDSLRSRYPRDLNVTVELDNSSSLTEGNITALRGELTPLVDEAGVDTQDIVDYRYAYISGLLKDGVVQTDAETLTAYIAATYADVYQFHIVPLEEYNQLMSANETLGDDEVLIYASRTHYSADTIAFDNNQTYHVKGLLDDFFVTGNAAMSVVPTIYVVVPDFEAAVAPLAAQTDSYGNRMLQYAWTYGFFSTADDETQETLNEAFLVKLSRLCEDDAYGVYSYSAECIAQNRADFYGTYGGLFFLGIMLSIVFICAAVLIIYYKQISEGYEDQSRFSIMQKVGMTKHDIRRSVNSQLLTVFFLPLVTAGVHLGFAFPFIRKLLMLFNLNNFPLLLMTTLISFVVFALLYTLVYRVTSNVYFGLVSDAKPE